MASLEGCAQLRGVRGRWLPLLAFAGCFDEGPQVDLDLDDTTSNATSAGASLATTDSETTDPSGSAGTTTDAPEACEADALRVPVLADLTVDWAVVHVGEPGAAPAACPAEYVLDRVVFDHVVAEPTCRCSCTSPDDVCGVDVTTTAMGCVGVVDLDLAVDGCRNISEVAEAMAVESMPPSATCRAAAEPRPGPGAVPVTVCRPLVETQTCMPAAPQFTGACFVATAPDCPDGTNALSVEPIAIACEACEACDTSAYCGAHRLALFDQPDCAGPPIDDVGVPSPCIPTAAVSVQLVAPTDVEPTGCADAAGTTELVTICCASM